MRLLLQTISYLSLALLFISTLCYLFGAIEKELLNQALLVATIAWFGTCPFWIGKERPQS